MFFSERARLAPPWPLTSSHLNTASFYYLLDLSRFSLLSTLFGTFVFSFSLRIDMFLQLVPSCTRAAVVATVQPTAIQQHHNNNSSSRRYIQQYVRVDQREGDNASKHAWKSKSSVAESQQHVQYEYFMFPSTEYIFPSFFVVPSSFIARKANRQQVILIFPSTGDTQPCVGPPSKL